MRLVKDLVVTYAGASLGAVVGMLIAAALFGPIATGARQVDVFEWVQWGVVLGAGVGAGIALRVFRRRRPLAVAVVSILALSFVVLVASKAQAFGMLIPVVPGIALVGCHALEGDRFAKTAPGRSAV